MPKKNVREFACSRLLAAAESRFAELGLRGASLRSISAAAGHSNNFAAQYHFKNKDALWQEVYRRRNEEIDGLRAGYLAAAHRDGRDPDLAELVGYYLRPYAEVADSSGRCTYARFLSHLLNDDAARRWISAHYVALEKGSASNTLLERIHEKLSPSIQRDFRIRVAAASRVFLCSIALCGEKEGLGHMPGTKRDHYVETVLGICVTLLDPRMPRAPLALAPAPDEHRSAA